MTTIFNSLIHSILVEDTPYRMTFYHGTDFSNIPSIAKQGLKPFKGEQWSTMNVRTEHSGAVYFTSDFEKAARYAVGARKDQLPVVLEVVISTPRRFNRMRDDPMDRSEEAWNEDGDGTTKDTESFDDLRGIIEDAVKAIILPEKKYFSSPLYKFDTLQEVDGLNLYKLVTDLVVSLTKRISRNDAMAAVVKRIQPGELAEFVEMRQDGTLKLTSEYWQSREQVYYQKGVPPSAIKFAWVRLADFADRQYVEKVKYGVKMLPHEAKGNYDDILDLLKHVAEWDHGEKEIEDYEEYSTAASDLGYPEVAEEMDKLALMTAEQREAESDKINDNLMDMEGWIGGEQHSQDVVQDEVEWGKVPFNEVGRLIKSSDGHPILPGLEGYMTGIK